MNRSSYPRHYDLDALRATAMLLGIWIPNFFYWGCNQFITQRTLGARSLAEGQRGFGGVEGRRQDGPQGAQGEGGFIHR